MFDGMKDYMLYKEALAARGYSIIKTEELEKLHINYTGVNKLCSRLQAGYAKRRIELTQLRAKLANLREDNKRLRNFTQGRGMVSEADGFEEVAILVCGLHDRVDNLQAELNKAQRHATRWRTFAEKQNAALKEAREAMEWMVLDPDDGYDRAKLWLSAHSAPSKKGE